MVKPEMTLQKVQLISRALVQLEYKVWWLQAWNSHPETRKELKFSKEGVTNEKLDAWMPKATFWAELEHATVKFVLDLLKTSKIHIDWKKDNAISEIKDYAEDWRIILWDDAYYYLFRAKGGYNRSLPFVGVLENDNAMKRVAYRYFKRELLGKKATKRRAMPKVFGAWLQKGGNECMFTAGQQQGFTIAELQACPWYLKMPKKKVPADEQAEKDAIMVIGVEEGARNDENDEANEVEVIATTMKKPRKNTRKNTKVTRATITQDIRDTADTTNTGASKDGKGSSSKDKARPLTSVDVNPSAPLTSKAVTNTNPSHCPTNFFSMTTESFLPSQLHAIGAQGINSHGIESYVYPLCTSLPSIIQHTVKKGIQPPELVQLLDFAKTVGKPRKLLLGGVVEPATFLDLVIGDIPDGLPVPDISNIEDNVPVSNKFNGKLKAWFEPVFEYAQNYLQDNEAILFFQPDMEAVRSKMNEYAEAYGFKVLHEWWGINEMYLTSPDDLLSTVQISLKSLCTLSNRFGLH